MADCREGLHLIPAHMHGAVSRYIEQGIPMGGFGTALFANDLMTAAAKADADNQAALFNWTVFIYNYCPSACHGSYEKVNNWQQIGGLSAYL